MGNCIICRMMIEHNHFMDLLKHHREDHYLDEYVRPELQKILGEENVTLTKTVCYHNVTKRVKDGIVCDDCNTQIMTYVLGGKRFFQYKNASECEKGEENGTN